jgi:hypothetical protein
MVAENPHRELITEVIIGDLYAGGRLTKMYNALHGWRDTIDIDVNKLYECNEEVYTYINVSAEGEEPKYEQKYNKIGKCKVLEVDEYDTHPILIEYHARKRNGEYIVDTRRVTVNTLTAVTN